MLAPLLVALGVIGARQLPWRTCALAITGPLVVAGLYGAWAGPGDNWAGSRTPVMMLGTEVSGAPFGGSIFQPGAAAAAGLVAGLLIVAAARRRVWATTSVAGLLIAAAVVSGVQAIDSLRDNSTVGQVQVALADVDVERLVVDGRVSSTMLGAVAWEVGLDRTSRERSSDTTHLLLPPDAVAPSSAVVIAELAGAMLWELG